jgi:hypothetical protein
MTVTPYQAALDVIDRATELIKLDTPPQSALVREDLRRVALAMGVAAIDTHMHWLIRNIDLSKPLPRNLGAISVPFAEVVEMGNKSIAARKLNKHDRPTVRARNAMNDALLRMTFQSSSGVKSAMDMLGVRDLWGELSRAIRPIEPKAEIIAHLDDLAKRRNSVVHEGDLRRLLRPRTISREAILSTEVVTELNWIRAFLKAVDSVT